jgi:putative tricarboxylic transport membrane protein
LIITDAKPSSLVDHPVAIVFLLMAIFSVWRLSNFQLTQARAPAPVVAKESVEAAGTMPKADKT